MTVCSLVIAPLAAFAGNQTGTTAVSTVSDYWDLAIALTSPVVVWALSRFKPNIPKAVLPAVTPLIGVLLGYLINWIGQQNLSWFEAAKAGAMAVFVRETVNQWVTKRLTEQPAKEPEVPAPIEMPVETPAVPPPVPPAEGPK